jgi:hypothetical protein
MNIVEVCREKAKSEDRSVGCGFQARQDKTGQNKLRVTFHDAPSSFQQ